MLVSNQFFWRLRGTVMVLLVKDSLSAPTQTQQSFTLLVQYSLQTI